MSPDRFNAEIQSEIFVGSALWKAMGELVQEVTRYLAVPSKGVVSLKVAYRGERDWLAVLKRYTDEGKVEVLFGSGSDFVGALVGLETALEHDAWRLDKWDNKAVS